MNREESLISSQKQNLKQKQYTLENAIQEFEELKNIALSCLDKNGNPNISAAMRAVENKAKIAGLYQKAPPQVANVVQMGEIKVDGEQLKLKIGEEID
ncbi:MAG: hypothetical protein IJD57_01135 [Candidatus Gastranaerophilales bacterium]|nr:hypothetical protein [Candidatus Gastranaerophilales bacterium]